MAIIVCKYVIICGFRGLDSPDYTDNRNLGSESLHTHSILPDFRIHISCLIKTILFHLIVTSFIKWSDCKNQNDIFWTFACV